VKQIYPLTFMKAGEGLIQTWGLEKDFSPSGDLDVKEPVEPEEPEVDGGKAEEVGATEKPEPAPKGRPRRIAKN